ncbi:hypothetical protein XENOCAPTIV_026639 [Xenoophorus captivus]|uniref:Nucleus accumbens associated 1, BEN and BTB (POZ) domain containing n=1 Tax=Xenoophorus captivus TaxID=1517983 RepID=A0ABV0QEM5_9TELE
MAIPNFGNSILECLNEQRLQGLYCDVSVMVKGHAFKVLTRLYATVVFRIGEELVLEMKDTIEEVGTSPITQTTNSAPRPASSVTPLPLVSRLKTEQPSNQTEAATPYSVVCTPVAKRLWEGGSSRDGGGLGSGGGGGGARKAARYSQEAVRGSAIQTPGALGLAMGMNATTTSLAGMVPSSGISGNVGTNGNSATGLGMSEGASPGTMSTYASDSPISYHDDEEEEEGTDESAEEQYRQICNMYTMYSMLNMAAGERVEALPDHTETRGRMRGRDLTCLPPELIAQIGNRCHPKLYEEGDPAEKLDFKESEMNAIAADMCTNARRVVRKSWIPKLKLLMAESDAYSSFLPDGVKTEEDTLGADQGFEPASLETTGSAGMESGGSSGESLPGVGGDGGSLF